MIPINIVKDHVFNSKSDPDANILNVKLVMLKLRLIQEMYSVY